MNNILQVPLFNPQEIRDNTFINIISKQNTEKNARDVIKKLLCHFEDKIFKYVIVSPSIETNNFYYNLVSNDANCKIYNEYNSNIIEELIEEQIYLINKKSEKNKAILILDNCLTQFNVSDKQFKNLIYNSMCYDITIIFLSHSVFNFPPDCVANFDYIISFNLNENEQKKIWNSYARVFPKFSSFKIVFDELTKNGGAIVIDNNAELFCNVSFIEGSKLQTCNSNNNWFDRIKKFLCCF